MRRLMILPFLALTGLLAACGGEASDESVERGAAASSAYTLCVQNDSSRAISSSGDGSPAQPEGFLLDPGEGECASADPDAEELVQNMMSEIGPSWTTRFTTDVEQSGFAEMAVSLCSEKWYASDQSSKQVSCSGNPFLVTVSIDPNASPGQTATITFADQ